MRGGSYYESSVAVQADGTATAPIVIKAYSGEQPILDGRKPEFLQVGNSAWQLHDSARQIYRSTNTYANAGTIADGFLEEGGKFYHLVAYEYYEALSSDTQLWTTNGYTYVGPGVFFNTSDNRIYVRLQPASQEATYQVFNTPANVDPRQNILHIGLQSSGLTFSGAHYIEVEGLDVSVFRNVVRISSGSSHLTLRDVELMVGEYGLIIDDGSNYVIDKLTFHMHLPDWISWDDMKEEPGGAAGQNKLTAMAAASVVIANLELKNCRFLKTHDAIVAKLSNSRIHHNYMETEDDAIQLHSTSSRVEFDHNIIIGPGPSHHGSSSPTPLPGTTYIHHNVIDVSKPIFYARKDPTKTSSHYATPITRSHIFGSHNGTEDMDGDPWKVYQNTLVAGSKTFGGHQLNEWRETTGSERHELYNNIILMADDFHIHRQPTVSDGDEIYDGNIYWRPTGSAQPFFLSLYNGSSSKNYYSLSSFKSSADFTATKSYYPPGWEASGIEANPQLANIANRDYRPATTGPAASGAVNISARAWPQTAYTAWRGAIDPNASNAWGDLGPQDSVPPPPPPPPDTEPPLPPQNLRVLP